jgi:hypothetical protein
MMPEVTRWEKGETDGLGAHPGLRHGDGRPRSCCRGTIGRQVLGEVANVTRERGTPPQDVEVSCLLLLAGR